MTNPAYGAVSAASKIASTPKDMEIDLQDFSPLDVQQTGVVVKGWTQTREKYVGATWVAKSLVLSFAGTIGLVLLAGIVIVAASPSAETAEKFVAVLGQVMDSLTKFATAVFGPLLAFVLGFYFSEKKQG